MAHFNFSGAFTVIEVEKMQQPNTTKGRVVVPKRMIFWKNSKRSLIPPSLSEAYIAIFSRKSPFKALYKGPKSAI